ncbi:putative metallo-hydrolase YflN [Lentibacillus sp. JNUCC-1]|nr:putative metallo-hydrolase YflN [Lentibacillus sp. JNUCC-1]
MSYFREDDRVLIAGDAFITVRQDSFYNVLIQKEELNGPPRYLTTDWKAAKQSVEKLAALTPEVVITGHGVAVRGQHLKSGLKELVKNFDDVAVPDYGRFVDKQNHH